MQTDSSENLVILGVTASDAHAVANHLIALDLRERGFRVVNLGVCTPTEDFMKAYQRNGSALAIVIGSLNGHATDDLSDLTELKRAYQINCPIILGGNLSVGSRKVPERDAEFLSLGVNLVAQSAAHLVSHLEALRTERRSSRAADRAPSLSARRKRVMGARMRRIRS